MKDFAFFQVLSIAAVASYFIPALLVLLKALWRDPFFLLFAGYWAFGGLINIADVIPGVSRQTLRLVSISYNMLDIPIILALLYYTSTSIMVKRYTATALYAVIIFEVLATLLNGFNYETIKYTLGAGITIVLTVIIWEIIRYLQKIEHSNRQTAKIFIYAALLFEYGTFIVIYIFDYIIVNDSNKDSYLIYYASTLVAILIASCGYLLINMNKKNDQSYFHANSNLDW